jgi:hypothetical protein
MQNVWNGEMVDDFKEDVNNKRAKTKIDLMTLRKSVGRCHGYRSARRGHYAGG